MTDKEFGFSLVSEKEIRANEEILKKQIEETLNSLQELSENLQQSRKREESEKNKLLLIKQMIMPLLEGLLIEPEKEYIYWKDRIPQIENFIQSINKIIEND